MYSDKIGPTRTFCAQWYCCPGNTDSTELLHSDDSLPPAIESRWSMNSCWKPPHCFGIADPIIRLSFSSDSHPIVGATWPSQLLTRGLRMSTCCCHRPTKSHPTNIALLKSVPLHAMKAVTNFSLFSRSFVTSKISRRVEPYNSHQNSSQIDTWNNLNFIEFFTVIL